MGKTITWEEIWRIREQRLTKEPDDIMEGVRTIEEDIRAMRDAPDPDLIAYDMACLEDGLEHLRALRRWIEARQ